MTGAQCIEGRRAEPHRGVPGVGWSFSSLAGPLAHSSAVDTVELDAATDPELPQLLQDLLVHAGGPQALPVERQLQPSLLAQEQHLEKDRRALQAPRRTDGRRTACPMPHPASPPLRGHKDGNRRAPGGGKGQDWVPCLSPDHCDLSTRIVSALGLSFTLCAGCMPSSSGLNPGCTLESLGGLFLFLNNTNEGRLGGLVG